MHLIIKSLFLKIQINHFGALSKLWSYVSKHFMKWMEKKFFRSLAVFIVSTSCPYVRLCWEPGRSHCPGVQKLWGKYRGYAQPPWCFCNRLPLKRHYFGTMICHANNSIKFLLLISQLRIEWSRRSRLNGFSLSRRYWWEPLRATPAYSLFNKNAFTLP